jgi:hypothetical protein
VISGAMGGLEQTRVRYVGAADMPAGPELETQEARLDGIAALPANLLDRYLFAPALCRNSL